jgi:hypothetical protein
MAVPIGCVGKLERYKSVMPRAKPPRAFSKHLIYKRLSDERRQKLVKNDPLIVPAQLPSSAGDSTIRHFPFCGVPFATSSFLNCNSGDGCERHSYLHLSVRHFAFAKFVIFEGCWLLLKQPQPLGAAGSLAGSDLRTG